MSCSGILGIEVIVQMVLQVLVGLLPVLSAIVLDPFVAEGSHLVQGALLLRGEVLVDEFRQVRQAVEHLVGASGIHRLAHLLLRLCL